ncbi:MAG TPA: DHH family phosphoesterase [Tepidisphaeraceae bacterium]|nr:DHH family phosphoesterase [Tepidisphaeraceae bacterium]
MQQTRNWKISEPHPQAAELASRLRTSPLLAQMLLNRGLTDAEACQDFLSPSLNMLHKPETLPGVPRAAERIAQAIRDKQKIVIYGDYDVDGITATTILYHAIRVLGGTAECYVPHRIEEGYGLNSQALEQLCNSGAQLIISVDCGITAIEPAAVCRQRGVDLIITDHHEAKISFAPTLTLPRSTGGRDELASKYELPDCYAIVHPRVGGEYSNPHLCGAGVAFKLAWAIGQAVLGQSKVSDDFRNFLLDATALAALGTIADVVPLIGENRVLAHFDLRGLMATNLIGIKALIASAQLTGQKLDSYHVGFLLAPRLNACGRMGHAGLAVEMLTTADETKAGEIAAYLQEQNVLRQRMEKQILAAAIQQIEELKMDGDDCRAMVVAAEGWHPGVIGIVASRLVDRFYKPAVMIALNNGHGQGSARSIPNFHITRAFDACAGYLESFGGHEMAAGLKLKTENVDAFRHAFAQYAAEVLSPEQLIPELTLETFAELRHLSLPLVQEVQKMAPFGHGNRRPILCLRNLEIATMPRRVGKSGDHLQLFLRQGNSNMKAIAFNYGAMFDQLSAGRRIDLAAEATINEFNGNIKVELTVKDIQFPV